MKILAACLLTLLASQALARPIDPLQRPPEAGGQLRYSIGLSYRPDGFEALGFDPSLGPFALLVVDQRLSLLGSLSYNLDDRLTATLSLVPSLDLRQSERRFQGQTERRDTAVLGATASLGLVYRLDPASVLEPRLAIALGYPWSLQTTASASLLRDPVVLGLSATLTDPLDSRPSGLSLGLSLGFVANNLVSFSLGSSLGWSLAALELPASSLELRTNYTLDPETEQEVSARTRFSFRGSEARLSFGLELRGLVR